HAARLLLTTLVDAGLTLHYHGDFDWGGIRIANHVIAHYSARPWRMATPDYLAAHAPDCRKLRGASVEASWDVALTQAMIQRGIAIHEEQVLGPLLSDLTHATLK